LLLRNALHLLHFSSAHHVTKASSINIGKYEGIGGADKWKRDGEFRKACVCELIGGESGDVDG